MGPFCPTLVALASEPALWYTLRMTDATIRHDWTIAEALAIYQRPLLELLHDAQEVHRRHHAPNSVQLCTLLSVKTGGCSEDCAY
jgi:biotin synthase